MDYLAWLKNTLSGNIKYMIVIQDPVNNTILSLHLGRGMVSSVKLVC